MDNRLFFKTALNFSDKHSDRICLFITNDSPLTLSVIGSKSILLPKEILPSQESLNYANIEDSNSIPYFSINYHRLLMLDKKLSENQAELNICEINGANVKIIATSEKKSKKTSISEFLRMNNTLENSPDVIASFTLTEKSDIYEISIVFIDTDKQTIRYCVFDETKAFNHLESIFLFEKPKEAILCSNPDKNICLAINDVLASTKTALTTYSNNEKNLDFVSDFLRRITEQNFNCLKLNENLNVCLGRALNYLNDSKFILYNNNEEKTKKWKIKEIKLKSLFKMNKGAVRALNIYPNKKEISNIIEIEGSNNDLAKDTFKNKSRHFKNFKNNLSSLFELLNRTKTAMGKRKLESFLRQPLIDVNKIERRLDIVELFITKENYRTKLRDIIGKMVDTKRVNQKLSSRSGNLQDIVSLYDFVNSLELVDEEINRLKRDNSLVLKEKSILNGFFGPLIHTPIRKSISDLSKFKEMVEKIINLETVKNHEYSLKRNVTAEFKKISNKLENTMKKMNDIKKSIALKGKIDKIKMESVQPYGHHLLTTKNNAKKMNLDICKILKTQKNNVRFTTRDFSNISKVYKEVFEKHQKIESEIIEKCMVVSGTFSTVFTWVADAIAYLDVLMSFAQAISDFNSAGKKYVRPVFQVNNKGNKNLRLIKMAKARHPVMEHLVPIFVPNDVEMDENSHFQILTGPNMGGKSTYIRQIGSICLMAQIGCFVPCESCVLTPIDSIFARVGAGDCLRKGVSTFMAEMVEMASVLKSAGRKSLLIIDELGRGTSTFDGCGISKAISEHIAQKIQCFTLFATHFHELTALEQSLKGVKNKYVEAKTSKDSFILPHIVKNGRSDKSYGLSVAALTGFPEEVIQRAKRKLEELERSSFCC